MFLCFPLLKPTENFFYTENIGLKWFLKNANIYIFRKYDIEIMSEIFYRNAKYYKITAPFRKVSFTFSFHFLHKLCEFFFRKQVPMVAL